MKKKESSYKDPSGFVFEQDNTIYRQINNPYKTNYDFLISSGLYNKLVEENLLIPHKEVNIEKAYDKEDVYKVIKPEKINIITYPYEWCFSQLKDAALLTLKIQKIALDFNMTLKDASSYNIQFKNGKPIFIDTLSFEKYIEGEPWIAYRQFCKHFLAPLLLMSYTKPEAIKMLITFIDGIPLDFVSKILPFSTKFNLSILTHIHLHAKSEKVFGEKIIDKDKYKNKINKFGLLGIIDSLETLIKKINIKNKKTEWLEYYKRDLNYTENAFNHKKQIIKEFLKYIDNVKYALDLGSNTGEFSRILSENNIYTISIDSDHMAVEKNYEIVKQKNEKNIMPLYIDLFNPSPSIGWNNLEREALKDRIKVGLVMALALLHHLIISNNLTFEKIAEFFYNLTNKYLIIEFVPKDDTQVKKLLVVREDIFYYYTEDNFIKIFEKYFKIIKKENIKESKRILFLMEKKNEKKEKN